MFILGSCLALNLNYTGCCESSLSPVCSDKGCYCDEYCHKWNDCCSDINDIACYLTPTNPIPTSTNIPSKIYH